MRFPTRSDAQACCRCGLSVTGSWEKALRSAHIRGLRTKQEAPDVHACADSNTTVIWGCDMEEKQAQLMILQLATLNPHDPDPSRMMELTEG